MWLQAAHNLLRRGLRGIIVDYMVTELQTEGFTGKYAPEVVSPGGLQARLRDMLVRARGGGMGPGMAAGCCTHPPAHLDAGLVRATVPLVLLCQALHAACEGAGLHGHDISVVVAWLQGSLAGLFGAVPREVESIYNVPLDKYHKQLQVI
jgi:hypothetical protein